MINRDNVKIHDQSRFRHKNHGLITVNQRFSRHSNTSRLIGILVYFYFSSFTYSVGCLDFIKKKLDKVSLVYFYFSCFSSKHCDSCRAFYKKKRRQYFSLFFFFFIYLFRLLPGFYQKNRQGQFSLLISVVLHHIMTKSNFNFLVLDLIQLIICHHFMIEIEFW